LAAAAKNARLTMLSARAKMLQVKVHPNVLESVNQQVQCTALSERACFELAFHLQISLRCISFSSVCWRRCWIRLIPFRWSWIGLWFRCFRGGNLCGTTIIIRISVLQIIFDAGL
jgi:hypothetical protein